MVMFLGACLNPQLPIMWVTEFMPGGDLETGLYYRALTNLNRVLG